MLSTNVPSLVPFSTKIFTGVCTWIPVHDRMVKSSPQQEARCPGTVHDTHRSRAETVSMEPETFTVRDRRRGFLWISNSFFDAFVGSIQPSSFTVYVALARLASNDTQSCYPSYEKLAEMTGLSRATVAECLKELKKCGAVEWEKQGKSNVYYLLEITSPISGLVQKTETTSPKNVKNQSSGLDSNKTNNKTQEQDLIISPPSSEISQKEPKPKKQKQTDPRYEVFIEAIKTGYERRGWRFTWGAPDGKQLKQLLERNKNLNVSEFRRWVRYYFDSEGSIPGAMPYTYLVKLPNYWAGPLNQYGKLIENKVRNDVPMEV